MALLMNQLLIERNFTTSEGLGQQGRYWYKHLLYAPKLMDGYTGWLFPGIFEEIIKSDWSSATRQVVLASNVIKAATAQLLGEHYEPGGHSISVLEAIGIAALVIVALGCFSGVGYCIYQKKKYRVLEA